jgi:branched-chain amino acid transport system substrate-binding protein
MTNEKSEKGWSAVVVILLAMSWAMSAQAQYTDGGIKIGVLSDMSGLYAEAAGRGSVLAAQIAVEESGINTKDIRIEVVGADHKNRPDVGAGIARQWYDIDGVDVIVDVPQSAVALAVSQLAREKNKVLLASTAATSDLTGKACSPNTVHWTYDSWMLANGLRSAVARTGDTWFFVTANYAFGHALERDMVAVVARNGGKVLGNVRHPLNSGDLSAFLLHAQASGARIIGLASSAGDMTNAIRQASEFGIPQGGQNVVALLVFLSDVHALGLKAAQGLIFTASWYWDLNDRTRAWARKFAERNGGKYPTMGHAGVYSAVIHYLKAVEALKSDADGKAVVETMKAKPTEDPVFGRGTIREDGRKIHPVYLFEVKKPNESRGLYDYYKIRATIPAEEAFRPLHEGDCHLVRR